MEPLNHQWPEYRDKLKVCLLDGGQEAYEEMRKAFLQSSEAGKISLWTEQLMVYFVYTYFCGSVYNCLLYTSRREHEIFRHSM